MPDARTIIDTKGLIRVMNGRPGDMVFFLEIIEEQYVDEPLRVDMTVRSYARMDILPREIQDQIRAVIHRRKTL